MSTFMNQVHCCDHLYHRRVVDAMIADLISCCLYILYSDEIGCHLKFYPSVLVSTRLLRRGKILQQFE